MKNTKQLEEILKGLVEEYKSIDIYHSIRREVDWVTDQTLCTLMSGYDYQELIENDHYVERLKETIEAVKAQIALSTWFTILKIQL